MVSALESYVFKLSEVLDSMLSELDPTSITVYTMLLLVPIGKVVTYSTLARIAGTNPRKVAALMRRNPLPLIIPCHRVVMKNGSLGGYSLGGTEIKKRLLEVEGVKVEGGKVAKRYFYCRKLLELVGL